MFDLRYGLRKWRASKIQWLSITLGFAVFIAVLTVVLQLGQSVFFSTPSWVATKGTFYTVGRQNNQGNFVPIKGQTLAQLEGIAGIRSVAKVAFKTRKFRLGDDNTEKLQIAYFSANFVELIKQLDTSHLDENSAYVSQSIWQRLKAQTQLPFWISSASGKRYKVQGVIPTTIERIGSNSPDIWLAESELMYTLPFRVNTTGSDAQQRLVNQQKANAILDSFPMYFAVVKTNENINKDFVLQRLNQQESHSDLVNFREHKNSVWVIDGVEFSPKLKQALTKQWYMLLILVIIFGFLSYFNFINVTASRLFSRVDELRVRITLGARLINLIRQLILEQLPMLMGITCFSGLLLVLLVDVISNQAVYQLYFDHAFHVDISMWLVSLVSAATFVIWCSVIPIFSVLKGQLFARASAKMGTKSKLISMYALIFCQLFFTMLVVVITVSMLIASYQYNLSYSPPDDVVEYQIEFKQPSYFDPTLQGARLFNNVKTHDNFAWSAQTFFGNRPTLTTLSYSGLKADEQIPAQFNLVTSLYFDVVNAKMLFGQSADVTDGVVINHSTAKLLSKQLNSSISALIGMELSLATLMSNTTLPIAGIVQDLPHYGFEKSSQVIVYTHFNNEKVDNKFKRVFVYVNRLATHQFEELAGSWLRLQGIDAKVEQQERLDIQLAAIDKTRILLLKSSVFMALLVLLLLCVSFYFQCRLLLNQQQIKFGLMRALGAMPFQIFQYILFRYSLIFITATVAVLLFIGSFRLAVEDYIQQPLYFMLTMPLATLVTFLTLLMAILLPSIQFQRMTILSLLRYRE